MGTSNGPEFVAPPEAVLADLRASLGAWFAEAARALPWRETRDPYAIWVSEAMLQQTRVETVLDYWPRFLERFPTITALAEASEEAVLEAWSGLGYYRRARSLQAAAKVLLAEHDGEFPRDQDAVLALPGVGPYTAGAVLSIAYNLPVPIVDGNVERVFARLFRLDGVRTSGPLLREAWKAARTLVVERPVAEVAPRDWNQALMELGATICKPAAPACERCPVETLCAGRAAGVQASLPRAKLKKKPIEVSLEIYVASDEGKWLLERRPVKGLMAGMWQFPTVETVGPELFPRELAPGLRGLEPLGDLFAISHGITKHRIKARVRRAQGGRGTVVVEEGEAAWVTTAEARGLALTGMARKVMDRLERRGARGAERGLFGGEL